MAIRKLKSKVYNKGPEAINEKVKGEVVTIPSGGMIEVPRRRAIDIKGHNPGINVTWMIDIVHPEVPLIEELKCNLCGEVFGTKEELASHYCDQMKQFKPYLDPRDNAAREPQDPNEKLFESPFTGDMIKGLERFKKHCAEQAASDKTNKKPAPRANAKP